MFGRLLGIRPRDYRDAAVGFATLLLAMAAHAVLEAARDALFLATLPPTLLPWAYLAMAVLALGVIALQRRVLSKLPSRLMLSLSLVAGALVTAAFWFLSSLAGSAFSLVAFYVWTGVLVTIIVTQFWLLAGDVMDLGQAKRAFAVIASGGLLGATLGSLAASAVLLFASPRALPLVAAGLLASAAIGPFFFSSKQVRREAADSGAPAGERARLALLREEPYLRHLLELVLLGTIAFTGVDYVFKAFVAREVAPESLGDFFARYYAILNGLALLVQLAVAPWLLRTGGIHRLLLVMPVLLLSASLGVVAIGTLWSVLALKGIDGTLRHSVNRVGTEILYLPLSNDVRQRFKAFIEAVGQRGGQALASVAILAALALGAAPELIAWGVLATAAVWYLRTIGLEKRYVELFRRQLKTGAIETRVPVPELDLRSLEALVAALSAEDDVEAIAALDMFEAYDKTSLIPPLILFHPSRAVVLRALELFTGSDRPEVKRIVTRLTRHQDAEVRAAALRVYAEQEHGEALLARRLDDTSRAVQATALVGLVHAGQLDDAQAERNLHAMAHRGPPEARLALAQSLHLLSPEQAVQTAGELLARRDPEVDAAVAHSLATAPHETHIPVLIQLLADRDARTDARSALAALGDVALTALQRALADTSLPRSLRRHLPRTISRFPSTRAVAILERALRDERDDVVVFKILRGLGRMRADDPGLSIDHALLESLAREMLERAVWMTSARHFVEIARQRLPAVATSAAELLSAALSDQEQRALERAFRLMHILAPAEELEIVYDALRSRDREIRARGRELLEHIAPDALRLGVLALVDDASVEERLANALSFFEPDGISELLELEKRLESAEDEDARDLQRQLRLGYVTCVSSLLGDRSRALSAIAGYHLAELDYAPERILPSAKTEPARVRQGGARALELLAWPRRGQVFGAS